MSVRHALALNLTPLLLRVGLGVTFLMAGLSKIMVSDGFQGQQAAILANLGVLKPAGASAPSTGGPSSPLPPPAAEPAAGLHAPTDDATFDEVGWGLMWAAQVSAPASGAPAARVYVAEDFPEPVKAARVYHIALLLHAAAHPPTGPDGKPASRPIWPAWASGGRALVALAWAAAIAEAVGGALVLLGLFTRLSALGLAGTMATAMWLTELGPAVAAGQTLLGFLPDRDPLDVGLWRTLLWQFALLLMSLGVLASGAGALSVDRVLFGRSRRGDDAGDEDDDGDE